MSSKSWSSRTQSNELLKCVIPTCPKRRTKVSRYCRTHMRRKERWGDARFGFHWNTKSIQQYLDAAQAFVRDNREHPGVAAAIEFLDSMLSTAYKQTTPPSAIGRLARAMRHLSDFGVTGEQLLSRAICVLYYSESEHRHDRVLEVQVRNTGNYALLAAPRLGNNITHQQYGRQLGYLLWNNLKTLFVHIIVQHRKEQAEAAKLQAALNTPFSSPDSPEGS